MVSPQTVSASMNLRPPNVSEMNHTVMFSAVSLTVCLIMFCRGSADAIRNAQSLVSVLINEPSSGTDVENGHPSRRVPPHASTLSQPSVRCGTVGLSATQSPASSSGDTMASIGSFNLADYLKVSKMAMLGTPECVFIVSNIVNIFVEFTLVLDLIFFAPKIVLSADMFWTYIKDL